jgi:preprotein translocase subunit SecG
MNFAITLVHVFSCIFVCLFVLVQSGKGADISASLGGSSQTIFGSSGGANFFTRATAVLAAVFFTTSITLTILQGRSRKSVFDGATPAAQTVPAPAAPAAPNATAPAAPTAPATK